MNTYHFVLATKNFLVREEPVEEILRERTMYYKSINKTIDFWFVLNPTFLDIASTENFNYNLNCSYAAIVSLDQQFICWLKLRIGFVTIGSFQSDSLFLKSNCY
uniref:Ycf54 n=1 Tax=Anotrichium furcellatum TaxID=41999 RepID=A0A4D6WRX6_9FLOR|nr:hypothetical protein [Anotrichium furcellatum]